MARILARKAFQFEVGLDYFKCIPGMIQDMPDKFKNSMLFKMAQKAGEVDLIENAVQQKEAETDPKLDTRTTKKTRSAKKEDIDVSAEDDDVQ